MKGLLPVSILCLSILFTNNVKSQDWIETNGIDNTLSFEKLVFTNVATGVAIDDANNVWLSPNGSLSWENNSFSNQNQLNAIEPISDSEIWVVGANGTLRRGIINNGSISWGVINSTTNNTLNNAHFIDSNAGWLVGDNSTLRFTQNSLSFSTQSVPGLTADYNDIYVNDDLGIIVTSSNRIGISRNGGKFWELGAILPATDNIQIEYANGFFYVLSSQGVLMRSNNGDIWTVINTPVSEINSFDIGLGALYIVGNGGETYSSPTFGNSWQEINGIPSTIDVNDISCTDNGCYAAGTEGKIYWLCKRITVGGRIWGDKVTNCTDDNDLENGYANVVVNLLNGANIIATTTSGDKGNYQFIVQEGSYTVSLNASNFTPNGALYNNTPCGTAIDPNNNISGDQNGQSVGNTIATPVPIDLRCGEELGAQGVENLTVDFGLTFGCSTNGPNSLASTNCNNPTYSCNLNNAVQGCKVMNSIVSSNIVQGCSKLDSITNRTWFTFYGGTGNYQIIISPQGCFPGSTGMTGMKVGVVKECDDNNNVFCKDVCGTGSNVSIPSTSLQPGQVYYIWIDGCDGSVCGYDITISGNYVQFVIPAIDKLLINGQDGNTNAICGGSDIVVEAKDLLGIYNTMEATFFWEIKANGVLITALQTDTNFFAYTLNDVNTYQICLVKITNNCESKNINGCNEIILMEVADEDFGLVEICQNDLVFYTGPTFVNGNPNNTNDPNGDGTIGWQDGNQLFPGTNTVTITNALGCTYDQTVEIVELIPSPAANITELVCDGADFPIYVGDQNYFAEVINKNITINNGAENGCDSFIVLNIIYLDVEGDIQQLGCDSSGVNLQFVPSFIKNTANRPIVSTWYDGNGNVVPDDGDNDPYTITVPYSANTYTLELSIMVPGIGTCAFIFDHTINFALPTIVGVDSLCIGESGSFLFTFPTGINETPLWNVDNGNFTGLFNLNQPITIDWDTPGVKTLTLAYQSNGCYVEQTATVVVLPKYESSNFACNSGDNSVTFTWPNLPFNQVESVNVLTGQSGTLGPNSFVVDSLNGGEGVTIEINIVSDICASYSILALCGSEACDSIANLPNYSNCTNASSNTICDIRTLQSGCATMNNPTTINPGIACLTGSDFNLEWIPFTAGTGNYNIDILVYNCNQGTIADGMQYAIFEACDLANPIICSSSCTTNNVSIGSGILNPGQDYVIMLNGCNGTICDYSFIISGDFTPYTLPSVSNVTIDGASVDSVSICEGTIVNLSLVFDQTLYSEIYGSEIAWVITNLNDQTTSSITTASSSLLLDNLTVGDYEVCFMDITNGCSDVTYQSICKYITVLKDFDPLVITCSNDADVVTFTWTTDPDHLSYDVVVSTGQTGVLTGNTYTVTGLQNNEEVTIEVTANVLNGCQEITATSSCVASDCPTVTIVIDFGGPITVCLKDSVANVNFTAGVTPVTSGTGVFSGPGIIDPVEGICDPYLAGVGTHTIIYTFTSDLGCVYTGSIELVVGDEVISSFELSDNTICLGESINITFNGTVNPNTDFVWNFGQGNINSGSGMGPYNITFNNEGIEGISLALNDDICGMSSYFDTLSVVECLSCVCDDLIDTTIVCTTIFDPVCGCDGVTYSNACEAQFYAGVKSWTKGPCNNTAIDTIRAFCDDDNPLTENDHIDDMCVCVGDIIIATTDYEQVIKIYPNPTTGMLYFDGFESGKVKVYDVLGQLIIQRDIKASTLDISTLSTGIYLVKVENFGVVRVYKE